MTYPQLNQINLPPAWPALAGLRSRPRGRRDKYFFHCRWVGGNGKPIRPAESRTRKPIP